MMPPLVEETTRYGRKRIRCTAHNKVAYFTRERAEMAAETIRADAADDPRRADARHMSAYEGDGCGFWHVTRGRRRFRRDEPL